MIKWSEMTTEERDRLVHEKVFGNPAICLGKLIVHKKDTPSRAGGIAWSYYQCACTNCEFERDYMDKGTIPEQHAPIGDIPHYSTDMNAAWLIVVEMNKPQGKSYILYARFIEELDRLIGSNLLFDALNTEKQGASFALSTDSICLAALKACCVEIEL